MIEINNLLKCKRSSTSRDKKAKGLALGVAPMAGACTSQLGARRVPIRGSKLDLGREQLLQIFNLEASPRRRGEEERESRPSSQFTFGLPLGSYGPATDAVAGQWQRCANNKAPVEPGSWRKVRGAQRSQLLPLGS